MELNKQKSRIEKIPTFDTEFDALCFSLFGKLSIGQNKLKFSYRVDLRCTSKIMCYTWCENL